MLPMNLYCCDRVLENNLGYYKFGPKESYMQYNFGHTKGRKHGENFGQQSKNLYNVTVAMTNVYKPTNNKI